LQGWRPVIAAEMAHLPRLNWRIRQDIVGFVAKVLPLTGRAWRGSDTEARPPHHHIGLETQTSPPGRRRITVWLAGGEAIHPKGGNVRRFGWALIGNKCANQG